MTKLRDLAKVIRSKNAGALLLTLDIMFEDETTYKQVCSSGALSPRALAPLYNVSDNLIVVIRFDIALAIKITLQRAIPPRSPGESDLYGAQQQAPLMDNEIAM